MLSKEELELLKESLGLDINSYGDTELDLSWQHKSPLELKQPSNIQLKSI
jgi:hypothetical protein